MDSWARLSALAHLRGTGEDLRHTLEKDKRVVGEMEGDEACQYNE